MRNKCPVSPHLSNTVLEVLVREMRQKKKNRSDTDRKGRQQSTFFRVGLWDAIFGCLLRNQLLF